MRDFARTPKSAIFGDFAKGGPREVQTMDDILAQTAAPKVPAWRDFARTPKSAKK